MHQKKALWEEGLESTSSSPLAELVSSLNTQRLHREVTLALREGLRDSRAEFSFLRVRGLRRLLKFLRFVAESDAAIRLFQETQSLPEFKVVPVLFQNTFRESEGDPVVNMDQIFGVEPIRMTNPATDAEIALALRVLEGCCLLSRVSVSVSHQYNAIKTLTNILVTRGTNVQGSCLDAFISLLLGSSVNQMEFEACRGIEKIAELIKDKTVDESLRLKCGEFLLLLIGHVLQRERPQAKSIDDQLRRLLGEKCASVVWTASQFGSTLDPEQRQTALHIQAVRVLECLELQRQFGASK
ncbi:hypothetical protein H6P81_005573 [Aristolochia fimbriata]|uniref:Uncharacterized protein n=1 Tax=Aristolochia fimbriata TaxID=158543 RepID=A0AAV7EVJ8_ARIFI|nr:hypothetical protein H6P81_005573 [Aristolochia fimbriata]